MIAAVEKKFVGLGGEKRRRQNGQIFLGMIDLAFSVQVDTRNKTALGYPESVAATMIIIHIGMGHDEFAVGLLLLIIMGQLVLLYRPESSTSIGYEIVEKIGKTEMEKGLDRIIANSVDISTIIDENLTAGCLRNLRHTPCRGGNTEIAELIGTNILGQAVGGADKHAVVLRAEDAFHVVVGQCR